jgi:GTP1/Obg family GTP-binding protein
MNIFSNSAKKEREKYLREKQNDREKHIYNKPINNYQQFIRDNQKKIKEEFPELSYTERFSKLAALWKLEKNSNKISPKEKHIYNKPINNYQQFIRDNQKKIKEDFPELSNTERFSKLAALWKLD